MSSVSFSPKEAPISILSVSDPSAAPLKGDAGIGKGVTPSPVKSSFKTESSRSNPATDSVRRGGAAATPFATREMVLANGLDAATLKTNASSASLGSVDSLRSNSMSPLGSAGSSDEDANSISEDDDFDDMDWGDDDIGATASKEAETAKTNEISGEDDDMDWGDEDDAPPSPNPTPSPSEQAATETSVDLSYLSAYAESDDDDGDEVTDGTDAELSIPTDAVKADSAGYNISDMASLVQYSVSKNDTGVIVLALRESDTSIASVNERLDAFRECIENGQVPQRFLEICDGSGTSLFNLIQEKGDDELKASVREKFPELFGNAEK